MRLDLADLPSDIGLLHHLVRDMVAQVETRDDEIDRLQRIIKQLQRGQFGRRSERLDADQLALELDDLDADTAYAEASDAEPAVTDPDPDVTERRGALPDHLPRTEGSLDVEDDACPDCGGGLHPIGETTSEMLDWVPARLRVVRIRRPKYGCRA